MTEPEDFAELINAHVQRELDDHELPPLGITSAAALEESERHVRPLSGDAQVYVGEPGGDGWRHAGIATDLRIET